jgi:hypothetical protein
MAGVRRAIRGLELRAPSRAYGPLGYGMLQRYVRRATERDLGLRSDWLDLIAGNPATEWS